MKVRGCTAKPFVSVFLLCAIWQSTCNEAWTAEALLPTNPGVLIRFKPHTKHHAKCIAHGTMSRESKDGR